MADGIEQVNMLGMATAKAAGAGGSAKNASDINKAWTDWLSTSQWKEQKIPQNLVKASTPVSPSAAASVTAYKYTFDQQPWIDAVKTSYAVRHALTEYILDGAPNPLPAYVFDDDTVDLNDNTVIQFVPAKKAKGDTIDLSWRVHGMPGGELHGNFATILTTSKRIRIFTQHWWWVLVVIMLLLLWIAPHFLVETDMSAVRASGGQKGEDFDAGSSF